MCGVDDDFDLIVYAIAAPTSAPEMRVLLFILIQWNVRQIRLDAAMNVLRICPSQSLTVFIQQIPRESTCTQREAVGRHFWADDSVGPSSSLLSGFNASKESMLNWTILGQCFALLSALASASQGRVFDQVTLRACFTSQLIWLVA